jgi:pre-mRNA-splicing factor SPF27
LLASIVLIDEVLADENAKQEETGQHLSRLESRWQDLVSSTVQLEMANTALEGMVANLRRKRDELKEEVAEIEAQE